MTTVWIVDDDMLDIRNVHAILYDNHYRVEVFTKAAQLLSRLTTTKPDLIIVGTNIYGPGWVELLDLLHQENPKIKVAVARPVNAGHIDPDALEHHAAMVLVKSFDDPRKLLEGVNQLFVPQN